MVAGYHLIWTAYGWWLPNDPRGSTSRNISSDYLRELGEIHFGRKKIQPSRRLVREFYERAREKLKQALLTFQSTEVQAIATAFSEVARKERYTCYACAAMPDHAHLLPRKHRDTAEMMIDKLQEESRIAVRQCDLRLPDHPVWTDGGWKGFESSQDDMKRTIRYIEQNPVKIGLPKQHWSFVTAYDGWLPSRITKAKPQARNEPPSSDSNTL
jgi:REP element-mobilizing transposase RayT